MKILVIDDHRMFADVLQFFLQQRPNPGELIYAQDAAATYSLIDAGLQPELILLDLNLPGISGLSLLRKLREREIWSPTLVISASQSPHDARRALDHGALGFVSKASNSEELLSAIDTVLRGEIYLPPHWHSLLKPGSGAGDNLEEHPRQLTDRQTEVLHLVAQGYANKNIADMLNLSENTVKVHLREAFKALGVTNRTAGVREAQRLGYLQKMTES